MDNEAIIFVKATISLDIGDVIEYTPKDRYNVVYIDYNCQVVVIANKSGNTDVLGFKGITDNFKRVVK